MKLPCEIISEPYLAQVRRITAQHLSQKGYSQQEIADLIQVSQAIISNYLNKPDKSFTNIPNLILSEAALVGKQVSETLDTKNKEGIPQSISLICNSCKKLRQGGATCLFHKMVNPYLEEGCTRCNTSESLISIQINREHIITNLQTIYQELIKTTKHNYLIPEIGLQIVIGTSEMTNPSDIAGFPGRINKRKTGLPATELPIFGASETLSQLLLTMKESFITLRGIAGIKTSEWLLEKLNKYNINYFSIPGFDRDFNVGISQLLDKLDSTTPDFPLVIVDIGSIGYEPISYILAESSEDLAGVFEALLH